MEMTEEIMADNFPNLAKYIKLTNTRISAIPKCNKPKKFTQNTSELNF